MMTDHKRSIAAPDVPSAGEVGLPDMVLITWNGVLAPAGTSSTILDRLQKEIGGVMNTQDMKERMLAHAAAVTTCSREEFATIIREDLAKWTRLIKASGLRSEK